MRITFCFSFMIIYYYYYYYCYNMDMIMIIIFMKEMDQFYIIIVEYMDDNDCDVSNDLGDKIL